MCGPFLQRLVMEESRHSTLVGRLLLPVLLGFRLLLLAIAGLDIYRDDQSEFTCNTQIPGCKATCYDAFHPLSPLRFWLFQVLLVAVPSAIYLGFTFYHVVWHWEEPGKPQEAEMLLRERGGSSDATQGTGAPRIFWAYVVQLGVRLALEATALWGQHHLYGSKIPGSLSCRREPCPGSVTCILSRPSEKTILLNAMLGISGLCALFTLLELLLLGLRRWLSTWDPRAAFAKCCPRIARGPKKSSSTSPEAAAKEPAREAEASRTYTPTFLDGFQSQPQRGLQEREHLSTQRGLQEREPLSIHLSHPPTLSVAVALLMLRFSLVPHILCSCCFFVL